MKFQGPFVFMWIILQNKNLGHTAIPYTQAKRLDHKQNAKNIIENKKTNQKIIRRKTIG